MNTKKFWYALCLVALVVISAYAATQLQLRRGTTAQNNAFTGAEGEIVYDTQVKTVRVHDGATAGGFALQKAVGDASGLTTLNASQLSSGTVPDARFPATLPAASGANLTALNASSLSSGTLAAGRLPTTIPSTNFTGNGPFLTNVSGTITHSVLAYGANNGGSVDAWVGVNDAALAVRNGGGTLFFPDGAYRLTNNVLLTGRTVSGSPWNNSDGNVRLKGSRLSRLFFYGGTNCIEAINAMRMFTLSDLHIIGTNTARNATYFHDGILMHGPTGASVVEDVSVAQLRTGIYLHDMTGLALRNVICYTNFIGVATGWQPADVTINGRFEKNYYGVFVGITNGVQQTGYANKFYSPPTTGAPTISGGTFGYNEVGILLARGMLNVMNVEFEHNTIGFQLGFNSANAYEATFDNTLGANPTLRISHLNTVGNNDIHVYRQSTIKIDTMYYTGSIQLKNAGADASIIDSDTAVTVTKSGGGSLTVNRDWRYVNGALVPRTGMSFTNLVDVPSGLSDLDPYHPLNLKYVSAREEFIGGTTTSGSIGQLGWSSAGTVALVAPYNQDWDGKFEFTTAATSNASAYVYLANHIASVNYTNYNSVFRFKLPKTNTVMAVVGIQNYGGGYEINYDSPGTGAARRGAGYFLLYTNGTQFRFERRSTGGAISASFASTVVPTTNWNELVVSRTNNTTYMSLNGESPVNIGTALDGPTALYSPFFAVVSGEPVAKSIQVDYWSYLAERRRNDGY